MADYLLHESWISGEGKIDLSLIKSKMNDLPLQSMQPDVNLQETGHVLSKFLLKQKEI